MWLSSTLLRLSLDLMIATATCIIRCSYFLFGMTRRATGNALFVGAVVIFVVSTPPVGVAGAGITIDPVGVVMIPIWAMVVLTFYALLEPYWSSLKTGDAISKEWTIVATFTILMGGAGSSFTLIGALLVPHVLFTGGLAFITLGLACACAICEPPHGKTAYRRFADGVKRLSLVLSPSPHPGTA